MDIERLKWLRERLLNDKPHQFAANLETIADEVHHFGFKTLGEFVRASVNNGGLGLDDKNLKALLYFNKSYEHYADKLSARLGLAERAKSIEAVGEANNNQYAYNNSKNVISMQGNSSTYRIAKLKRDYPEVAERLEAGEFKSVSEAERAAGVQPPKKRLKRLHLDLDDLDGSFKKIVEVYEELKAIQKQS